MCVACPVDSTKTAGGPEKTVVLLDLVFVCGFVCASRCFFVMVVCFTFFQNAFYVDRSLLGIILK
jgi:hypothetical protein